MTAGLIAVAGLVAWPLAGQPQETMPQEEALALLAKIDGKAKFDPAHPKRVIGIDI
jgi:hypothetical protein